MNTRRKARRARHRREEGAVLLVVMLVLLMVTATATFAIHSTASEVRAAGYSRMAMQTSYLGETALVGAMDWVDRSGPRVLVDIMAAQEGRPPLELAPFEPTLATGKTAYRLFMDDLDPSSVGGSGEAPTLAPDNLFRPFATSAEGPRNAYAPLAVVDVYDVYVYTGVMPGFSASGGTSMRHLRATYTARGRARLRNA
ncbi:MAG: hypothetical protein H5U40_14900, partial [Polyangiaceae bacterium]|nr:hypothetical protein [Polyangiaceae bacterium]